MNTKSALERIRLLSTAAGLALAPLTAQATPSTTFWAPSTPYLQPYGVLHVTYDTYFWNRAGYTPDYGLTMGVLPFDKLQMEVGFDVWQPSMLPAGDEAVPIQLNAKIGSPEGALWDGSPGWSAGVFGGGFVHNVNDYNVAHFMLGKTFGAGWEPEVGVYYGTNKNLMRSSTQMAQFQATGSADSNQFGAMIGLYAPPITGIRGIDHIQFAWDIQTGENGFGATGGGVYVNFTPAIDLLTGPVYFFDPYAAGLVNGSNGRPNWWVWTLQLDIDWDLKAPQPAK